MKKYFLLLLLAAGSLAASAQRPEAFLSKAEAERIETVLASDAMRGRRAFTPDIDRAADFIAGEFKAAGLQPIAGANGYLQQFSMVRAKPVTVSANLDGVEADAKNIMVMTCQAHLEVNEKSGYEMTRIKTGSNLQSEARKLQRSGKNLVVLVDKSFANSFGNLARMRSMVFKSAASQVFILADADPATFTITAEHEIAESKLANVVGVLPGKSRKDEYVVFSGHYDHLGVTKPVDGDSIYNGANDDAAGTTAVIMLARYFKALNNNERTIIFAAFTAEEVGGFGSQYFSRQLSPEKVMAMFNIEMIGTESKWGTNSAYITGYDITDMGAILSKELEGTGFAFYPDPYPQQQLFYRSDNATLARLGVPAHTISTSKMDVEPHYHKLSDQVETLDMENMANVVKAIALSAKSIIAGKATPSRVQTDQLR